LGLLEKARALGLHLVQTGPNLRLDKLPEPELEQFIQAARDWGIGLELGTRGIDPAHLVRQVALAQRIGATLIRTLPEIGGQYAREAGQLLPVLAEIRPVLERAGVRLAVETGRLPAADLKAVLDAINSPW